MPRGVKSNSVVAQQIPTVPFASPQADFGYIQLPLIVKNGTGVFMAGASSVGDLIVQLKPLISERELAMLLTASLGKTSGRGA
jgi:hypothetical protein